MVEWPLRYGGPPFAVDYDKEFNIPSEEQRMATPAAVEASQRVASRPKVVYSHPMAVPATPSEAPSERMPMGQPRTIPLDQVTGQPLPVQSNTAAQPAQMQQAVPGPVRFQIICSGGDFYPDSTQGTNTLSRQGLWLART